MRHVGIMSAVLVLAACHPGLAVPPPGSVPLESLGSLDAAANSEADRARRVRPEAEVKLGAELLADVRAQLDLGERSVERPLALADTADWLAARLEGYGYPVERVGFEAPDGPALNLRVTISGLSAGDEVVIVGTHFDSPRGSLGANATAGGVAALLALARQFFGKRPFRTLHLVWFSHHYLNAVPVRAGSLAYVGAWKPEEQRLVAMLELESLACFRHEPNSQTRPTAKAGSGVGDFIQVRDVGPASELTHALGNSFVMGARVPLESESGGDATAWSPTTDATTFVEMAVPAVVVSDTGARRCPTHGMAGDTLDTMDEVGFAHAVSLLPDAVLALTGPLGDAP